MSVKYKTLLEEKKTYLCSELEEEQKARKSAEDEVRKLKRDHDRIHKRYTHYKQLNGDKDVDIKKKDLEIEKLSKPKPKKSKKPNESSEEGSKSRTNSPQRSVRRRTSNPPLSGPPQCGLPQIRVWNSS